ncbi:hypothetical protein EBO15_03280 [Actinomadura harenae]|uniref:Uncharacterized protein n=1 Tax=Actinomadura harenae TaxID=2483351 RepID=A0A3M2MCH1_9ACTN|nr:hypothetical protein EBO15_03280 [Actinomadura harenae]
MMPVGANGGHGKTGPAAEGRRIGFSDVYANVAQSTTRTAALTESLSGLAGVGIEGGGSLDTHFQRRAFKKRGGQEHHTVLATCSSVGEDPFEIVGPFQDLVANFLQVFAAQVWFLVDAVETPNRGRNPVRGDSAEPLGDADSVCRADVVRDQGGEDAGTLIGSRLPS